MKRVLSVLCVLVLCGVASAASAQEEGLPQRHYIFDGSVIDGSIKGPSGLFYQGMERAKFERLLRLKKSFLPEVEESVKGDALR